MANQFDITDAQASATQRHDSHGVVYLLSGTLPGRGAVPDAEFRWATQTFSGALGVYEGYIGRPALYSRGQPLTLGEAPTLQPVRVPVRNLPFAHAPSLVAAITDEDYAWEQATATMRVGYLGPGQRPEDLAAGDWAPLALDGFLGSPQDIRSDGFVVPVYPRGAKRNQKVRQSFVGVIEPITPASSVPIDREDVGKPFPIVVGQPDSWIPLPTLDQGVRGFTVSAQNAGDTVITIRPITVGGISGLNQAGAGQFSIHYRTPVYGLVKDSVQFDEDTGLLTLTLTSGLAADIPRGAFAQDSPVAVHYQWAAAGHRLLSIGATLSGYMGWLFPDGSVVPADHSRWAFDHAVANLENGYDGKAHIVRLAYVSTDNPNVPVFFNPAAEDVVVTTQPDFNTTAKERLTSKLNYPTGGTGANNSLARDGSTDTAVSLGVAASITLTFPSPPSPFANDDTTGSTLHVVTQGNIDFTNAAGSTTFGQANGTGGANRTFRFTQGSARDYNETVRCVGAGGSGGSVVEVWWEQDLEVDISLTRDTDAVVGAAGTSGEVGPILQFARLVMRVPTLSGNAITTSMLDADGALIDNFWREQEPFGFTNYVPLPTTVMAGLQGLLLGEGTDAINTESYDAAHAIYDTAADEVRWNFALLDEVRSWTDLERQLAEQARAHFYYGPSGHEILYRKSTSGLEAETTQQTFRLPGTPGANVQQGQNPLMERTSVAQIVNGAEAKWQPNYVQRGQFEQLTSGQNAESLSIYGVRRDTQGQRRYWAHSSPPGHPTYDANGVVSGILNLVSEQQAFASTRFAFDTAWVAYGLDRGSIVRVAYPVTDNVFRNVAAEVEDIRVSPANAELYSIICRAVAPPQLGQEPLFAWLDLFTVSNDQWTTRLDVPFRPAWADYWSKRS